MLEAQICIKNILKNVDTKTLEGCHLPTGGGVFTPPPLVKIIDQVV